MATDFFQRQDRARAQTGRLVTLFLLGVAGTVAVVYAAAVVLFALDSHHEHAVSLWHPEVLLATALGVGLVVGGGSAIKVAELASGGKAVALSVGGKEVPAGGRSPAER